MEEQRMLLPSGIVVTTVPDAAVGETAAVFTPKQLIDGKRVCAYGYGLESCAEVTCRAIERSLVVVLRLNRRGLFRPADEIVLPFEKWRRRYVFADLSAAAAG